MMKGDETQMTESNSDINSFVRKRFSKLEKPQTNNVIYKYEPNKVKENQRKYFWVYGIQETILQQEIKRWLNS